MFPAAIFLDIEKAFVSIWHPELVYKVSKVVPVLPLTEHHAMKAYWGVKVQLHPFFDLCTRRR